MKSRMLAVILLGTLLLVAPQLLAQVDPVEEVLTRLDALAEKLNEAGGEASKGCPMAYNAWATTSRRGR